jgi:hypothetical protein
MAGVFLSGWPGGKENLSQHGHKGAILMATWALQSLVCRGRRRNFT